MHDVTDPSHTCLSVVFIHDCFVVFEPVHECPEGTSRGHVQPRSHQLRICRGKERVFCLCVVCCCCTSQAASLLGGFILEPGHDLGSHGCWCTENIFLWSTTTVQTQKNTKGSVSLEHPAKSPDHKIACSSAGVVRGQQSRLYHANCVLHP